jgi:hypothetical protein
MSYYYLVAGLPMLALGRAPQVTLDAFLERCREHLSADDAAVLEDLLATGGERVAHPFATAWRDHETRLRNAVARARASRLGRDATPFLRPERGFDTYTLKAVEEAFARPSPIERELELDRFRWQEADELAGRAVFSVEAVLAYAIKLRIAERWSRLEPDAGRRVVGEFVTKQGAAAPL